MKASFPAFKYRHLRSDGLQWSGPLQPTPESPEYAVRIVNRRGMSPRVYVDSHQLDHGCRHLYSDGALCLYWPKEWGWAPDARLAGTIVPWAALWLYYYEIWQECGEWMGPSSPHGLEEGEKHR